MVDVHNLQALLFTICIQQFHDGTTFTETLTHSQRFDIYKSVPSHCTWCNYFSFFYLRFVSANLHIWFSRPHIVLYYIYVCKGGCTDRKKYRMSVYVPIAQFHQRVALRRFGWLWFRGAYLRVWYAMQHIVCFSIRRTYRTLVMAKKSKGTRNKNNLNFFSARLEHNEW